MLKKRQKYTALLDLILSFFSNRIPNCDLTCSMENVEFVGDEFDCFLSFTRHVWWKCRAPYRTILKGKDCMTRVVCRQGNGRWVLVHCGDSWPCSAHVVVAVGVQDRQASQLLSSSLVVLFCFVNKWRNVWKCESRNLVNWRHSSIDRG